ncbi:hypothetical protein QVD17_19598 [Tagetes erecta]|uniref:Uncharacterized protein n=1 Tax=Tagetes erecta TaxID=13708 RepID=A0AAD8KK30_TARER|nr:hypothetical protein QVD17_19598 [Tagetes erecta]
MGARLAITWMLGCLYHYMKAALTAKHDISKPKMEGLGGMGLIRENFEGNLGRVRGDESECMSGGSDNLEGASGDEQDVSDGPSSSSRNRRQKYHCHTPYQIQELEA